MAGDRPKSDDEVGKGTFASPPCFMHELDPAFAGLAVDPRQAADVTRWRKAARERLIAQRLAMPVAEREAHGQTIARQLTEIISSDAGAIVGVYWPFRAEPDLRPWMVEAAGRGLRVALPIVIEKGKPLVFREWTPGARLERGVWNIPYPADGAVMTPTVVIAPLVGFDRACYRLGYGGGFFDRTLAAAAPRPLVIGVGHPSSELATIYPQAYDIPMDWIVTGLAPVRARA